jgi:PBP1b-binding outer membrane lipoprotein LpoB
VMKKYVVFILLVIILSGCTHSFGKGEFNKKFDNLDQSLNKEDWDLATKQMSDLTSYYENNLWKLQLVGEETEYKDLYETFSKLKVLIEEKDRTQSRMELETAKTLVKHIYSL